MLTSDLPGLLPVTFFSAHLVGLSKGGLPARMAFLPTVGQAETSRSAGWRWDSSRNGLARDLWPDRDCAGRCLERLETTRMLPVRLFFAAVQIALFVLSLQFVWQALRGVTF